MNTYRRIMAALLVVMALAALNGCRESAPAPARAAAGAPRIVVERVVGGLQEPVSLVFLSPTHWLVAERRSGRIRWIEHGRLRAEPFAQVAVPTPAGYHEYGLLGLAVDPDYPDRPFVYAFHTVGSGGSATGQRIVRFTVQNGRGTDPTIIVDGLPAGQRCCHNGGRILFGSDGMLYVTLGDTQRQEQAQNYDALPGKVLRYRPDGTVPADNPFELQRTGWAGTEPNNPNTPPEQLGGFRTPVYAIGFRNPFGIALNRDTGDIYVSDNGPDHGDEINHLATGDHYGWPEVMGASGDARFRNPLWSTGRSIIAPTGMAFYAGPDFPQFRGHLFFAAYNDGRLRRAAFDGPDRIASVAVVAEAGTNARLDVAMGPDGRLYFTSLDGIYRLRAGQ